MAVKKQRKKRAGRWSKAAKKIARSRKRKRILKKVVKYQAVLVGFFLAMYLAIGFWLGPGAIRQDIEGKVAGASTVLSLHIAGPPAKPVVTATPGCDSSSPYVQLSWDETNDTDDYDIDRDSAPLITGITSTSYKDTSVATETTYAYQVTANGPLGNTTSDEVSATTGDCYVPSVPATCTIVTMGDTDLTDYSGIPKTTDRTPTFTGTTNIPYALMRYEIFSGPIIIATSTANLNGYWSFTVPQKLDHDLHTIYVTATDPTDSTRHTTKTLNFNVEKKKDKSSSGKGNNKGTSTLVSTSSTTASSPVIPTSSPEPSGVVPAGGAAPLSLEIEISNKEKIVYAGSELHAKLLFHTPQDFVLPRSKVSYKIIDSSNNIIFEKEAEYDLTHEKILHDSINPPVYLKSGHYTIRAETQFENIFLSAENYFDFKEKPILDLGGGMIVTYPFIVSTMGYIFVFILLILLLFLTMLFREYCLARRVSFQIDEEELAKDGLIS
jgi:hypothetical protein